MRFALILAVCVGSFLLTQEAFSQCRNGVCRPTYVTKSKAKKAPAKRVLPLRFWRYN